MYIRMYIFTALILNILYSVKLIATYLILLKNSGKVRSYYCDNYILYVHM